MHSFQSALAEAFGGKEELEKRLRKARFERAAEHGRELMLNATKATVEGRLKDALTEIRLNSGDLESSEVRRKKTIQINGIRVAGA